VFRKARFLRIADAPSELRDNRRGTVELLARPAAALMAMIVAAGDRRSAADAEWVASLRRAHLERSAKLRQAMASAAPGSDGRMHPNRLLVALQQKLARDAMVIADGGDILSFARVGLSAAHYLDPGAFGCLGVGLPFGIAASLAYPERQIVVLSGDGAFGFNAIELDTAVRHRAPLVTVVANNGAWQIEVYDQTQSHGRVVGTRLQFADYAAMAAAFGMHAERVEQAEDLAGALERAFANRPALLDVVVTPDAVSSDARSGLAWVPDLQPLAAWDEAERRYRNGGTAPGAPQVNTDRGS
jgi:acetolactate synthase-1/2/3 large subunit